MLGFLPKERIADELPKRAIGRNRDERPVAEQRKAQWNELQPAASNRRQHEQIGESAIAGEQVEQAEEQKDRRKQRIEPGAERGEPQKIERPEVWKFS